MGQKRKKKRKRKSGPVGYIFNLKKIKVLFYLTYHLASGLVGYIFNLKKIKVLFYLTYHLVVFLFSNFQL
jgi:hypothetical protein